MRHGIFALIRPVTTFTVGCCVANEARRERTEAARNVLQERAHAAADTLATIMQDADAPAQTRVSAAAEILRQTVKYTEITDIMQQLDELEAWRREQEQR